MCAKAGRVGLFRLFAVAALAVAILTTPGCSGSEKAPQGREIRVSEHDFKITAPSTPVRAGEVTFAVNNKGPDSHELIVVKTRGTRLPLRSDGMSVDEDALEHAIPGALEPEAPGPHRLKVRLTPGHYELICNMSGHYFGGMRTPLVVQ